MHNSHHYQQPARFLVAAITLYLLLSNLGGRQTVVAQAQSATPLPTNQPQHNVIHDGLEWATDGPCAGAFQIAGTNYCTHGPDPAPPGVDIAVSMSPIADLVSAASIQCEGEGVSGKRTQVMYVRASDRPDRYNTYLSSFHQWAAEADAIYQNSAAETGGVRRIRFVHDANCNLIIPNVQLSPAGDDTFANTVNELQALGYNRADRKYMIFVDSNILCGWATMDLDEQPGAANLNNNGPDYAATYVGCWGGGIAAHELMHNLGGVQLSAPHTSGGGHCVDEYDLMCYSDEPFFPSMQIICQNSSHDRIADCNHDDYFNTNPPANSYLATHWNAANNEFLIGVNAQFDSPAYSVDEGAGDLTVTAVLSEAPGQTIRVNYDASNGTAKIGADYLPTKGTLTFLPNETRQSFTVPIKDDSVYEGNETFIVTLSAPANASLGSLNPATITILDNDPLPVPSLISPAEGALLTQYTPTFDWSDSVPAPDRYQIQIAVDNAFVSPAANQTIASSHFIPAAPLNPNTRYYWRVRVFGNSGQSSAWSAARAFRTALAPPLLSSPGNVQQAISLRPLFDWGNVSGASSYNLQVAVNQNFAALVLNMNVSSSAYVPTADLPKGTLLFWRVRTLGANGPSAWSRVRHFDTPNPPGVPTLLTPAHNVMVASGQPTLDWSDSAPNVDHYEVQLSTDPYFTTTLGRGRGGRTAVSQYTVEAALTTGTYYWRVRAVNAEGHLSNWSSSRSFRVP
ncbi:MAG: hypothetical protein HYZ49_00810 [Chloroflexi bacterium]|nr:hypothetical protein [Chloroflexota bacterium]